MIVTLEKVGDDLLKVIDGDLAAVNRGAVFKTTITKARNPKFHRKFFALLNHAYESWECQAEYKGQPLHKNPERFRHEIIILAGYHTVVPTLDGSVRLIANSISFSAMDEGEFSKLYEKVVQVILDKVLSNYTRDDLDSVIAELLGFT